MLSLIWGVTPVLVDTFQSTDEMITCSGEILRKNRYLKKGEKFIITAGAPVDITGTTNMIKIHEA
jgi:pyruvate kinase